MVPFKRYLITSFLFIFFLSQSTALFSNESKEDAKYLIKFGTIAPEGTTWIKIFHKAAQEINTMTNGEVRFVMYPGCVMGDEPVMIRKMRMNQLHAGGFTIVGIIKMAPEMAVVILPCIFRNIKEVDFIRQEMFDTFKQFFADRGFILHSWIDMGGFAQIFSENPVRTPDDLKKHRMFVWSDMRLDMEIFDSLGVNSIPLPLPEVLPALQTGLINAVYNSPLGAVALQWHTQIKYITKLDLAYGPAVVVSSESSWRRLPSEYKTIIQGVLDKYSPELKRVARRDDDTALLGMYKRGIKIIRLTPEEKRIFIERSKIVWDRLADDMYPGWLLDQLLEELKVYRGKMQEGIK